jgi:hypothetical protein
MKRPGGPPNINPFSLFSNYHSNPDTEKGKKKYKGRVSS